MTRVKALASDLDPPDDIQETGGREDTSRRRAAVPCRCANDRSAGMTHSYDITLTVNGERIDGHVEGRKSLVDFLRDDLDAHRQPCRLRARRLRRLHRAREWRDRARLPDAGRAMRRRSRGNRSKASRIPARSPICRTAFEKRNALAMRLLYARHAADGARELLSQTKKWRQGAEPRRHPRAYLRQLLPLHRLSRHRRCGGIGRRRRGQGNDDENRQRSSSPPHRARTGRIPISGARCRARTSSA